MSALIHSQVNEFNKFTSETIDDENTPPIHDQATLSTTLSMVQAPEVWGKVFVDGHIALQLQQCSESLLCFRDTFHLQVSTWLTAELVAMDVQLPRTKFSPSDHVSATPVSPQSTSLHQQTLGALPDSTVVLIDVIVIHSTYSVCRNIYELRSAPVVLL